MQNDASILPIVAVIEGLPELRCCTAYDTREMALANRERSVLRHQCNIKRISYYKVVVFRVTVNTHEMYLS